ncbi:MAG: hypothetical protein IJG51_11550 [Synergistaceae bacterium]|nr:hypothetical protein [Synergistaceae bacterium]MBQ3346065.1 hypothetical protein [Synergistaceae bacterium]MBQ3399514.1 hypothetical protein [Synergistaceae bacterium]MBQ3758490.1 hypothetical protein [Synergistaceae bacterium]MBQ6114918.1 hypothetical protein [Synergistaceae bacterium]
MSLPERRENFHKTDGDTHALNNSHTPDAMSVSANDVLEGLACMTKKASADKGK